MTATYASEKDSTKHSRIKNITQQIKSIKLSIKNDNKKKGEVGNKLKKIEVAISASDKKLRGLKKDYDKKNNELSKLISKEIELQQNVDKQKSTLATHIRQSYTLGKQPYLKLILNQEDPKEIGRQIKYFEHLNKARLSFIDELIESLKNLDETQQAIAQKTQKLEKLVENQKSENSHLKQNESEQKKLINSINQKIKSDDHKLKELIADKQGLENVVAKVAVQKTSIKAPDAKFAELKGKLNWPTKGRVSKKASTQLAQSKIKYAGVFIEADEKQPVKAVFPGTVVFADWLRGFGLLTIVDHGDNYMTLYGHNRDLLKQVGDPVEAGEVIASTGHSGGNEKTGLYFEVRHKGTPEDPKRWCA